ncbi:MAG: hypothetical protein SCJ93_11200 [Bacillota bacterium]|nr:hypothetical protein [Bacillota bacterium]
MEWYQLDKSRIVLEYLRVTKSYPDFKLIKIDKNIAWEGKVNDIPEGLTEPPLKIRLIYPDSYPAAPLKVQPIEPEFPDDLWGHDWHRWKEGYLCYIRPKSWEITYTAADVIDKIRIWYFNFLAYKSKMVEKMPDIGKAEINFSKKE